MSSGGNITRRGKRSWRLKYDVDRDPETGRRRPRYMTVRGKRADAAPDPRAQRGDRGRPRRESERLGRAGRGHAAG